MRRLEALFFSILAAVLALSCTACSGIKWEYDFGAAESKARLEQKDLFIYFRQWHSTECSKIESEWFLTSPEVTSALKDTINCWLEWDWSQEIASKYRLRRCPAFVFVRPDRKYSVRVGPISQEDFLRFAEQGKSPPPPSQ
ncbi:MAG: thioredoxin family protein [Phycisphaerales bacterium]|nr:MAG: thioredoxin family protein [Phycisphaerales bacterium]